MKTSVIDVHDMLSVLSVDELERRIGEVPGVESVTLNFAAKNATVRYDETRLEVADIKSVMRQKSYESFTPNEPAKPLIVDPHEEKDKTETNPPAKAENSDIPPPTATAVKPIEDKTEVPAVKPPEEKDKTETKPPAINKNKEKHASDKKDEMSADKAAEAEEMGHGGSASLGDMVKGMRNRFYTTLFLTILVFLYAPVFEKVMGFLMPLPFGISKELMGFILATPLVFYGGSVFFVGAYRALKKGNANMSVLVSLSVLAGYLFSVGSVRY